MQRSVVYKTKPSNDKVEVWRVDFVLYMNQRHKITFAFIGKMSGLSGSTCNCNLIKPHFT